MPVWGIVLPKEPFLELFQKEKSIQPNRKDVYKKIYKSFLENEDLIGVKYFGGIYSPHLERILGFEITNKTSHVILFDLKDLELINRIRNYAFEELGITPVHVREVGFDMESVVKYFSGEFKDDPLLENEDKGKYLRDLIRTLRFCGFEETNIF